MVARIANQRRRRSQSLAGLSQTGITFLALLAIVVIGARVYRPDSEKTTERPSNISADTVEIPVPDTPIQVGTRVRDIHTRIIKISEHQLPAGSIRSLESYQNAVTVVPLPAGLPLMPANFSFVDEASNPVIGKIPPGFRAMTVKVDATSSVEGWAGSGSIVDVLLVQKDRTTVIAEKVRVISAERSTSPIEGISAPVVPSTVTLLVTQEQCLVINTAIPLGRIAFALRSTHDEESWESPSFTADQLSSAPPPASAQITGFISVKDGEKEHKFSLTNGKWIPTEVVPTGFLSSRTNRD